jgi:hypothetical protein
MRGWPAALLVATALVAACSSVSIGIGLPIGRMGGISIGGTVPLPPPEPAAKPASSFTGEAAAASAPAASGASPSPR